MRRSATSVTRGSKGGHHSSHTSRWVIIFWQRRHVDINQCALHIVCRSYIPLDSSCCLIQNSSLMHEDKRCRPILFVLEGHEATGEQEAFPQPASSGSGITFPQATTQLSQHQQQLGGGVASGSRGGPGSVPAGHSQQPMLSPASSHPSLTACSSSASIGGSSGGSGGGAAK